MKPIQFVNRRTGELVTESVMGNGALKFAYETLLGRTLWTVLFGSKFISALMGKKYDSPASKKAIRSLVAIPGCQAEEAEKPVADYASFNEFFTRKLKPGARPLGDGFVSPADGRLMLYLNADADQPFPLKGATKNLREVFGPHGAPEVAGGRYDVAVVRLAPVDYHRFHFPCDCTTSAAAQVIPGEYHSVNPIALIHRPDVYADNERQIVACETAFGPMWMVDVGAFGVGTIVQTYKGTRHTKGDERGYFKFGGSTVILIAKAGAITYDDDIVANSAKGLESRVLCLEKIGVVT